MKDLCDGCSCRLQQLGTMRINDVCQLFRSQILCSVVLTFFVVFLCAAVEKTEENTKLVLLAEMIYLFLCRSGVAFIM